VNSSSVLPRIFACTLLTRIFQHHLFVIPLFYPLIPHNALPYTHAGCCLQDPLPRKPHTTPLPAFTCTVLVPTTICMGGLYHTHLHDTPRTLFPALRGLYGRYPVKTFPFRFYTQLCLLHITPVSPLHMSGSSCCYYNILHFHSRQPDLHLSLFGSATVSVCMFPFTTHFCSPRG